MSVNFCSQPKRHLRKHVWHFSSLLCSTLCSEAVGDVAANVGHVTRAMPIGTPLARRMLPKWRYVTSACTPNVPNWNDLCSNLCSKLFRTVFARNFQVADKTWRVNLSCGQNVTCAKLNATYVVICVVNFCERSRQCPTSDTASTRRCANWKLLM